MPIYEFKCSKCQTRFDRLCRIGQSDGIECPNCGGSDVTRVMSLFSTKGSTNSGSEGSCASCSSTGGCATCGSGCHSH